MHQKQSLTRKRVRTPIPHFTEPQFRNFGAGALRLGATAPVGHAVEAADRVGPETLNWARRRRSRSGAQVLAFAGGG